jgi:hypothetical protein
MADPPPRMFREVITCRSRTEHRLVHGYQRQPLDRGQDEQRTAQVGDKVHRDQEKSGARQLRGR